MGTRGGWGVGGGGGVGAISHGGGGGLHVPIDVGKTVVFVQWNQGWVAAVLSGFLL